MFFKKKNYFLNLCFTMMFLGIILGMNSTTWLMMWLSMEITLMFFIPRLMLNKSMIESFSCLKYFIFQCLGSIFFIMGSLDFFYFNTFGLFLKLGLFPNHFWILSMSKGMNWLNFFFLMTVQKILPLLFIILTFKFIFFIFFFMIFFNSLIGNLGSMNQMDLRLLMTFSSMNHISWMILSTNLNILYFYLYFFFYTFMLYFLYIFLNKTNTFFLFQFFFLKNFKLKFNFLMMFLLFFSFMGFPPFLGFFFKIISMVSMMIFFFFMYILIMLIQNLFISFSYIRVVMYLFINISRSIYFNKMDLNNYFNLFNFIIFMMLL